jgi:hypothetical protein
VAETGPRGHRIGSGDPLLLIHGLAHPPDVWESVLPDLERSFELLVSTPLDHHQGEPFPRGVTPASAL